MASELRRIANKVLLQRKTPLVGLRKLEVTYNAIRNDFHPHYHLVVSGHQVAGDLVSEWLKTFPEAHRSAQDIRPADMDSTMELFKYFTKLLTKKGKGPAVVYAGALDVIFQAMKGLRVFQPMGLRKDVSEDIDEVQAEVYQDLDIDDDGIWQWTDHDWVQKATGEVLSDYNPSAALQELARGAPPGG